MTETRSAYLPDLIPSPLMAPIRFVGAQRASSVLVTVASGQATVLVFVTPSGVYEVIVVDTVVRYEVSV